MSDKIPEENLNFIKRAKEVLERVINQGTLAADEDFFLMILHKKDAFSVHHCNLELTAQIMLNWMCDNGITLEPLEMEGGDGPQYYN